MKTKLILLAIIVGILLTVGYSINEVIKGAERVAIIKEFNTQRIINQNDWVEYKFNKPCDKVLPILKEFDEQSLYEIQFHDSNGNCIGELPNFDFNTNQN